MSAGLLIIFLTISNEANRCRLTNKHGLHLAPMSSVGLQPQTQWLGGQGGPGEERGLGSGVALAETVEGHAQCVCVAFEHTGAGEDLRKIN